MIFINPLYVVSHVIFIDINTEYVLVEKKAWNTIMNLLFKRRIATSEDRKKLKMLIYSTYVLYCNQQRIDYNKFNQTLSELQQLDPKLLSKVKDTMPIPSNISNVEVKIEEEEFFVDDEFVEEMSESQKEKSQAMELHVSKCKSLEEKFNLLINFNLARTPYHSQIVELSGFGRIKTLLKILCVSGSIKLTNMFEETFFEENFSDIVKTITQATFEIPGSRKIFYYCKECSTINSHIRRNLNPRNVDHELQRCEGSYDFYDFNGIIKPFEKNYEFKYDNYVFMNTIALKISKFEIEVTANSFGYTEHQLQLKKTNRLRTADNAVLNPFTYHHSFSFSDDINFKNLLEFLEDEIQNHAECKIEIDKLKGNGQYYISDTPYSYYQCLASNHVISKNKHNYSNECNFRNRPFQSALYIENLTLDQFRLAENNSSDMSKLFRFKK